MARRGHRAGMEEAAPRYPNMKKEDPDFPELTKLRAFDRQQHIQKSIEAGLSREEAEKHADHDLGDRDDTHP